MGEGLFVLTLALFFTHELDAIARHEWRMFPVMSRLDDRQGFVVFLLAHVPIFALILWFSFAPTAVGAAVRIIVAAFAIIHIGLHRIYRRHPANEFNNAVSQALIWGTGIAGALYLATAALAKAS
jgi:FlaA1/EpsC-like NDP-sugar epimerase